MVAITEVEPHSHAARHDVRAGDVLIEINGNPIRDVLDYRFYLAERAVTLLCERDGAPYTVRIRKGEYDDIGLAFETPLMDKKHSCKNGCIFCFIDQNPKGMRDSIYFKDDDSRLSFIHGNYITLTNMTDEDVARIVKMRFSPINISIHTTNPDLRVRMMKNKRAGEVLGYLDVFRRAHLSMCGQIVLCREVNDGAELVRTLTDLSAYFPELGSVSIVPAGLTAHREGLFPLSDFTPQQAREVIRIVREFGDRMYAAHGSRVFYAADEFYLKSKTPIPDAAYYEEYAQIENGVGMLRSFSDEFAMAMADAQPTDRPKIARTISIATGVAAYDMISDMARKVMEFAPNLQINVYKIINYYFGESITVTGLLTGRDIAEQLNSKPLGDALYLPENALRHGEDVFLCGMTTSELSARLGTEVRISPTDGYAFFYALLAP